MNTYEEWPKTSVFNVENTPDEFRSKLCSKNKKSMLFFFSKKKNYANWKFRFIYLLATL